MGDIQVIYTHKTTAQKKLEKLYTPDDDITNKIKENLKKLIQLHKSRKLNIPNSYKNGIFLLEQKDQDFKEPKDILFSKLKNKEYETNDSKSDATKIAKLISSYLNILPSFQKYKNEDNLDFIIKEHRKLFSELLDYRVQKNNSIETFKTDLTGILRIFRLGYNGKSHPLYEKYTTIQKDIGENIDKKYKDNKISEREEGQFLEYKYLMKERKYLEDAFNEEQNKNTKKAYKINQDLVLVSLYTLTPPLRKEIDTLKFTTSKPRGHKDNWVYFHNDGKISLELFEVKKKHPYISIGLNYKDDNHDGSELADEILNKQKKLAGILKESFETYRREHVFTNINKYPQLDNKVSSVQERLVKIFNKYGIKVGVNTFRKSFVSHEFARYQHTNAEKKLIATYMRSSIKYLDTNYNKITDKRFKNQIKKNNNNNNNEEEDDDDDEPVVNPIRQKRVIHIQKDIYEEARKRAKKSYEKFKAIPAQYRLLDGTLKDGTEASKRKLEQWRKKIDNNPNGRFEYRKQRYIREYNNNIDVRTRVMEKTLQKYGLSKYKADGTLKDRL